MRSLSLLCVVCTALSSFTSAHAVPRRQNSLFTSTTAAPQTSTSSTTRTTTSSLPSAPSATTTSSLPSASLPSAYATTSPSSSLTSTTSSTRSSTSSSTTSTTTRNSTSTTTSTSQRTTTTTSSTTTTTVQAPTTSAPSTSSTTSTSAATASAFASNSDLTLALSPIAGPVRGTGTPNGRSTWQLSIDDTSSGYKQSVTGFGAAVTDSTVTSFNTLSSSRRDQLYNQLFTSAGAGFSLMRHTIGASDLTGDPPYTYDDQGGQNNPSLTNFTLTSRGNAMASMMAQMQTKNANVQFLGSPWSAPGWMKVNQVIQGNTTNNNLDDGYMTNDGARFSQSFATYFVKYIQAFQKLGAKISAITLQNEPLNSQAGYPTMYMFDYEQAQLIQNYVGPALRNAGLSTSIWAYDHNTDLPSFPQTVLSSAASYVNTVAWHCYANPLDWTVLTRFRNSNPGVQQYMTECWTPASANWYWAANFTMGPLQNWASGAQAWVLGTDTSDGPHLSTGGCPNCQGLVTVTGSESYRLNTAYYMMAQFSRFMPRGATVLNGTGSYTNDSSGAGVQSVATLNPDGTRSVAILNTFGNDTYTTLTTKSGETWSANIPASSLVTWILPKK